MSDTLTQSTVTINTTQASNAEGITGGFKNLTFETALSTAQDLKVTHTLWLTGAAAGTGADTALVGNVNGQKLTVNVGDGAILNLGSAGGAGQRTGGTLHGDVHLSDKNARFNIVNGDFSVGNVTGETLTSPDGQHLTLAGATLHTGKVEGESLQMKINGGSLVATETVTVMLGEIIDGALTAGKKITTKSTYAGIILTRSTLHTTAGKTADGDVEIGAIFSAYSKSTISVGNNLTVVGNASIDESLLSVGNTLKVTGNINVASGSHAVVETLQGASTRTITIGQAGRLSADGSVLRAQKTKLDGANLRVHDASASLGELSGGSGTVFVNPGYVNVDSVAAGFGGSLLAGKGGHITVGNLDQAWVRQAIKDSGAAADSAVLGISKSVTLGSGSIVLDKTLEADGKIGVTKPTQKLYFGGASLLALDGSQFLDGTKPAAIVGDGSSTIFVQNNDALNAPKLHIANVKPGDTVHVLSGGSGVNLTDPAQGSAWLTDNITFGTLLFKGVGETNAAGSTYNVRVGQRAASTVFPQLSSGMAGLVDTVIAQYGLQTDSPNAGLRFVSRAVSNNYGLGGHNAQQAAATLEGAAQMGAVAGVQTGTMGAAQAASGAVTTRTSFASPMLDTTKAVAVHQDADGALSLDTGLNAGEGMKSGLGVWIMPLYQSNKTWGQKAENFKTGMSSDLGGIALGADYTVNDMWRFGAAFNVGGGYGQSSGDFNKTENNFNFWGLSLYGGWAYENFGLSADVGYTSNYSKVEQDMPASMAMGNLKSDITSSVWTAGLRGEYKFETSVLDIIPHVGVRYMGLNTDSYDVKSGGTVFKVEESSQSVWTFPVGVAFSKTITSESGWSFKPQVDLSVIPAAGDLDAKSKSRIPGGPGTTEMKMQVVDAVTFDGGLGFEVGKGDVSFGINYNIQASEHRTGHGVFGTLRYEF